MAPLISVITVSYRRPEILLKKLNHLSTQSLDRAAFEVVLCLYEAEQVFEERIRNLALPYHLTFLSFPKNKGAAWGRNACIAEARGRWLYLSDDDCLPEINTLALHVGAQEMQRAIYIGAIDFDDGEGLEPWHPKKVYYWNTNGANTSLPRDEVLKVGGFDDKLSDYGGEDILLGYKLLKAGLSIYPLPEAKTRHLGPNPMRSHNLAKARSAGKNAVMISRHYPDIALPLGVHPLILALKRLYLLSPLRYIFAALDPKSYRYEKAYLEGALEARQMLKES
ncbi:MAG: glycosyltransferase [Deinococcales bacterium]